MKKIVTAHLGSRVFQIEEDAYAYLNITLDRQRSNLDFERQVADMLNDKLTSGKQVITYPDVVDVLYQLGFSASDMQSGVAANTEKKLYRNLKDKMIGGVCSGLGDYFDTDPSLVRIFFVIAFFAGSFGFWVYLVLWMILPKSPAK